MPSLKASCVSTCPAMPWPLLRWIGGGVALLMRDGRSFSSGGVSLEREETHACTDTRIYIARTGGTH